MIISQTIGRYRHEAVVPICGNACDHVGIVRSRQEVAQGDRPFDGKPSLDERSHENAARSTQAAISRRRMSVPRLPTNCTPIGIPLGPV